MNILVTGGAGFIGSNIAETLVKKGENITIIDNLSTGRIENIENFQDKIKFIQGDILDLDLLKENFQGIDYVFHKAALPSVPKSVKDPILSNLNNVNGTLNVLVAAKDCNVKRVIYAGSSSAYGDSPILPKEESMLPNPLSPYAVAKLTGEQYCKVFYDIYGLETVILRYFNVFGPKQDPESPYSAVIPLFIKAISKDKSPTIFGNGLTSRDFTYVQNVIHANLLACKAENVAGQVFNIAGNSTTTLIDLVDKINEYLGKNIKPVFEDHRPGDIRHSRADFTKAKRFLNFNMQVSFDEGLKRTIEWYTQ